MAGTLTGRDVALTTVSAMVGAGIFVVPGRMVLAGAQPWQILLLFAVGGVVALLGALTVAQLAGAHPGSGGPFLYLRDGLGPGWGFLFQWSRFWVMQTAAVAVLARTCTQFIAQAFGWTGPMSNYWETVAAMGLVLATAGLNAAGLRLGRTVQAAMTALKVGLLLAFTVAALWRIDHLAWSSGAAPEGAGSWMLLAIFAFGGWTQITFMAGELRDPAKLPRPLAGGILGVTLLYLVALMAMLSAMPASGPGDQLAITVGATLFGTTGQQLVALAIAVAVLGGLHTFTMAGARLYQAAARNGAWWQPFARANGREAPATSLWFQGLWACFLLALSLLAADAFTALIASVSAGIWSFNALLGWTWFRTTPGTFRTPGGGWTAGLFTIAAALIVLAGITQDLQRITTGAWSELGAIWALVVIAAGAVVWLRLRHNYPAAPG